MGLFNKLFSKQNAKDMTAVPNPPGQGDMDLPPLPPKDENDQNLPNLSPDQMGGQNFNQDSQNSQYLGPQDFQDNSQPQIEPTDSGFQDDNTPAPQPDQTSFQDSEYIQQAPEQEALQSEPEPQFNAGNDDVSQQQDSDDPFADLGDFNFSAGDTQQSQTRQRTYTSDYESDEVKEDYVPEPQFDRNKIKGPLFVKVDDFRQFLEGQGLIKNNLKEANNIITRINEIMVEEDKEFDVWRSALEEINKKLATVERKLF